MAAQLLLALHNVGKAVSTEAVVAQPPQQVQDQLMVQPARLSLSQQRLPPPRAPPPLPPLLLSPSQHLPPSPVRPLLRCQQHQQ